MKKFAAKCNTEELDDILLEYEALIRLEEEKFKTYTDEEVRGSASYNTSYDENDGWEIIKTKDFNKRKKPE